VSSWDAVAGLVARAFFHSECILPA